MIKKIVIGTIILIVTLVVALTIFLMTFDLNHYREYAQKKLSVALGYPVQIEDVHTKLSFIPTIQISDLKVLQNGENPKPILEIPEMDATIEIIPLLKGKIVIHSVNIKLLLADLTLLSESSKTSSKATESEDASSQNSLEQLWISKITIHKALCHFMAQEKKEVVEFDGLTIKELNKLKFQVIYHEKKVDIEGSLGMLTKLISERKVLPVDLKIRHDNAVLTIKGQIGDLPTLSKIGLDVDIDIQKLTDYLKLWNIVIPKFLNTQFTSKVSLSGDLQKMMLKNIIVDIDKKSLVINASGQLTQLKENPLLVLNLDVLLNKSDLAKAFLLKPFRLKTNLEASQTQATLTDINLKAGKSDLAGKLTVQWKNLLSFKPNLTSSYLALDDIWDKTQSTTTQKMTTNQNKVPSSTVIPDKSIDLLLLQHFDLNGKIDIRRLLLPNQVTDYTDISLTPQLNKGKLNLPFRGKILSGMAEGALDINAKEKKLSLKVEAQNLDLDKIPSMNQSVKGARVNTKISLNSIGDTTKLLLSNLNGQLVLELVGGTIIGKKFDFLSSIFKITGQKSDWFDFLTLETNTDISCGAINVPIKDGVITSSEKIVLQTNIFNFILDGQIDLKDEKLNLLVKPSVNQTIGVTSQLFNTVLPIVLEGPWQNIKLGINMGNIPSNAVQTVTNFSEQVLSLQMPQMMTNTSLCQKVLGKEAKQKNSLAPTKQSSSPKATKEEDETLKQQFIQLLPNFITGDN